MLVSSTEKIESIISENRIKLHVFEPSNKTLWTVVGKQKEHWVDPDLEYCSCAGFYFNKIKGKKECYHLECVRLAREKNMVETIKFTDDEYLDFISSMIDDL